MRRIAVRQVVLFTAAVVVVAAFAAGLWLLSGTGAQADPGTVVGIDVDTTQNYKDNLGTIQECVTKDADATLDVDVYVNEIPSGKSLTDFSYLLVFDQSDLEVTGQEHVTMLLSAAGAGVPIDGSEPIPPTDTVSPHGVSVSEWTNVEEGPIKGVLGRYTLHLKAGASGLANLSLQVVDLSGPLGAIVPTEVRSATIAITGTECPTPTATPSPTPSPTPTPVSTRTLSMPTRGWYNFVWTGSNSPVATALDCIAGRYSIAYLWSTSVAPAQWLRYVPGQPGLSTTFSTVNQYDALWVLTTADAVTCSMPVASFPATATPTPTQTPSPTPTPTA